MELSHNDRALLEAIQRDLPLSPRPFRDLGAGLGFAEDWVIRRLAALTAEGFIREISPVFDAAKLGYKSTLAAVQVDAVESVAQRISRHSGVSHNYQRDHRYNLWFTLTVEREKDFEEEIQGLLNGGKAGKYLVLPARRTFKRRVYFRLTDQEAGPPSPGLRAAEGALSLSQGDKRLILRLQEGLALVPRPWLGPAESLGIPEQGLLNSMRALKEAGAVRRIAGALRHRRVGFTANGMVVFRVPPGGIEKAGNTAARYPQVSHCYQRQTYADWPYSLYAMVHGRSRGSCQAAIAELAREIGCQDYQVLYSLREFKKGRVRYFDPERRPGGPANPVATG